MTDGERGLGPGSEVSQGEGGERRIRRRRRRWYQRLPLWVQEYWVEFALTTAVLVAIFLLVEPWDIREALWAAARRVFHSLSAAFGSVSRVVSTWVRGLTLSDAVAFIILLGVALVAGWRARWRIVRNRRYWSTHCPQCGSLDLHRVHRRTVDHVLGWLGFPIRRYRCSKCDWCGMRIYARQAGEMAMPKPPADA